jgi:alpha-beta hydrolase superfamily lysophospholipase
MRILAILGVAMLLGACAGQLNDQVVRTGAMMPAMTRDALIMDDGARLPLRSWLPDAKPRAVIVALHGFNDYSNAFTAPAKEWAKHGIATFAYDQRGFGRAPARGQWVGTWRLDADFAAASRLVRSRYPGVPLFALGESMGGAVVITAVAGAAGAPRPICDGIILAAPAVWGRATMSAFERVALWTGDALFPGLLLTGEGLHITPSDNIEMLRALSRDPLVIKETRVQTVKGLVDLMDMALAAAPHIANVPMLLLYGQHDEIVPKMPTRLFIAELARRERNDSRIAWYEHGYHMLLRDLDARVVVDDVSSWIDDHQAALPSGADRRARDGFLGQGQLNAASGLLPPSASLIVCADVYSFVAFSMANRYRSIRNAPEDP